MEEEGARPCDLLLWGVIKVVVVHCPLYLWGVPHPHQHPGGPHPQAEGALHHHPLQPRDDLDHHLLHSLELGDHQCRPHPHPHPHLHPALGVGPPLPLSLLLWCLLGRPHLVEAGVHFWTKSGREFS